MGGFSNFAVSFSIISILTGAVTLYGHGLRFGGPRVMGWGWPLLVERAGGGKGRSQLRQTGGDRQGENRATGRWNRRGPWDLGRASAFINWVALAWVALAWVALAWVAVVMVLFVLPPNALAGYTFAGCLAALAVYWFGYMRKRFQGPKVAKL